MSIKTVTLLVPGLLDGVAHLDKVPAQELPELVNFSRCLSRGTFHYSSGRDYYSFLFDYFSIDPQNSAFPAAAPVDYLYQFHSLPENAIQVHNFQAPGSQAHHVDPFPQKRWVMRVDPCFMTPDRDQLVLVNSDTLDLDYDEATQLVNEINAYYQSFPEENFWQLELSPDRSSPLSWFLTSSKPINVHSHPTSRVKGHSIKPFLLTGENQTLWLKLFNEFQMILHQSELNTQRRSQGKLPVNSVWFWGAGQMNMSCADTDHRSPDTVFSNDPIVKGLSIYAYSEIHDLPHNIDELFMIKSRQHVLVVMEHLAESVRHADVYAWIDLMNLFEKEWLKPLSDALKAGQLEQLILLSPAGIQLQVTKRNLNQWWKRTRSYIHFMKKTG